MWQPSEEIIIDVFDIDEPVQIEVSYSDSSMTEYAYSCEITPFNPSVFQVSISSAGITINASNYGSLFEIEEITYRDGDDFITVKQWEDLPPNKDVVRFIPPKIPVLDAIIEATVSGERVDESGAPMPFVESKSYIARIKHDHSFGRDKLLEYLNASSS